MSWELLCPHEGECNDCRQPVALNKPRRKRSNVGRPKEIEYNLQFCVTDVDSFLWFCLRSVLFPKADWTTVISICLNINSVFEMLCMLRDESNRVIVHRVLLSLFSVFIRHVQSYKPKHSPHALMPWMFEVCSVRQSGFNWHYISRHTDCSTEPFQMHFVSQLLFVFSTGVIYSVAFISCKG